MTVITHITIEAKTKKENRKDMCEAVGKYAERKVETARVNNLLEIVKNLMESMKWTSEQAMIAMQISDKDKGILLKKL